MFLQGVSQSNTFIQLLWLATQIYRTTKRVFVKVGACVFNMQFELMTSGRAGHLLCETWLCGHVHVAIHDLVHQGYFAYRSALL